MIVVDANIAAKWLLPEPGSDEAIALQEGPHQLVAPDLIRLEVAAAITRRVRADKKPLPPKEAVRRYQKWIRLLDQATISLIPESDLLAEAVDLAVLIKHPLQDCLYLAAAIRLDAELITADETFLKRAIRHYPRVSLLPGLSRTS
jgi:predicted nucleic acid-binding protein